MNRASVTAALARGWTAAYTAGLPRETRDRRREEIASDLWEQQHDTLSDIAPPSSVAARVLLGAPADLAWRSTELRHARRLELMNLKVDREWDYRMRLISHSAIVVLVAFFSAVALDGPRLLVISLPLGAIVVAVEIRRLQRDKRDMGIATDFDVSAKRRRRAVVVAASIAVGAIGLLVESLPSQEFHDRFWYLLVAPVMLGLIVGAVALLMLGWSYLPRRDELPKE
jgi:hypothetical protein